MRLIDADKLIKILEEYANDKGSQAIYGEERLRLILGDCKIEIEKFPTTYDVDKVVEEMQDLLWDCYTDSGVGIDRKTGFEAYKREMERILRH